MANVARMTSYLIKSPLEKEARRDWLVQYIYMKAKRAVSISLQIQLDSKYQSERTVL